MPPVTVKRPAWIQEFQSFIMKGNVVDLAVGIIIGAAFTSVVGSLVKDVFTPVIGLLVGGIDFSNIFITLKGAHVETLEEARKAGAVTINVGLFLNAIIQFLIVGLAVFWMVKMLNRLSISTKTTPPPSKTEVLLGEIRDLLAQQKQG